jgi:hypothetical protein
VNTNQLAKVLGEIELLKLAILEGDAKYTNDGRSVEITVRIEGNKANGKIDILSLQNETEWEYKK